MRCGVVRGGGGRCLSSFSGGGWVDTVQTRPPLSSASSSSSSRSLLSSFTIDCGDDAATAICLPTWFLLTPCWGAKVAGAWWCSAAVVDDVRQKGVCWSICHVAACDSGHAISPFECVRHSASQLVRQSHDLTPLISAHTSPSHNLNPTRYVHTSATQHASNFLVMGNDGPLLS